MEPRDSGPFNTIHLTFGSRNLPQNLEQNGMWIGMLNSSGILKSRVFIFVGQNAVVSRRLPSIQFLRDRGQFLCIQHISKCRNIPKNKHTAKHISAFPQKRSFQSGHPSTNPLPSPPSPQTNFSKFILALHLTYLVSTVLAYPPPSPPISLSPPFG